ncbi:sterol desaturase family protein [Ramlibacter rhizophilus]|uniref:Beta-carotene hydroxylase n=1 Tax=Ramlibacter rhizophilus TaxID=1781167 RepID=A0A4Z0BGJ8_9BURK|nr:sterol desaturase family protein [Ramlibacter rhizophilus]TFY98446.1 beta-carotene hydroxylase [Ramlibacter rhizophilus]
MTSLLPWLRDAGVVLAAVVAMEAVAWLAHRYVMHGFGWRWHASHHEPRAGRFERNDLYALVFAAIAIALIAAGQTPERRVLALLGLGMTIYGALYLLVHDGLVHRRLFFRWQPRSGYLRRLIDAHRLHHAVRSREGCVAFGFLWAPRPERLRESLRRSGAARRADR